MGSLHHSMDYTEMKVTGRAALTESGFALCPWRDYLPQSPLVALPAVSPAASAPLKSLVGSCHPRSGDDTGAAQPVTGVRQILKTLRSCFVAPAGCEPAPLP